MTQQNSSSFVRLFVGAIIACLLLVQSGCVAVAVGAGAGAAVAYVRGDLDAMLDADLARSIHAVNRAIDQLKFAKVSEKEDALQAVLIARNATDRKIEFFLAKLSDGTTSLKIRVGTFGEDALQVQILEQIKSNL
jgi:hypothetical protein